MRNVIFLSVFFALGCGGNVKTGRFNGIVASYDTHAWIMPWVNEAVFLPEGLPYDLSLPRSVRGGDCLLVIASAVDWPETGRVYLSARRNRIPLGRARWSKPHAYIVFQTPETNHFETGIFLTALEGEGRVHLSAFRLRDRACGGGGDEPSDRGNHHHAPAL